MSEEIAGWFAGRVPDDWFEGALEVRVDREEILVIGRIAEPELEDKASPDAVEAARVARIERFREETRVQRIKVAQEAEHRFGRKVSWGARCGEVALGFTTLAAPVMTLPASEGACSSRHSRGRRRRPQQEPRVAWCVRLVGENQEEWIAKLREALKSVEEVRAEGPA